MRSRLAAEPFVAAALRLIWIFAFKSHQALIAVGEQFAGPAFELGLGLLAFLQVIEDEHVGVVAARSLLEAAARLTEQRLQTLLQVGERRGKHLHLALEGPLEPRLRKDYLLLRGAFENIAMGMHNREAVRHNSEIARDVVIEGTAAALDADACLSFHERRTETEQSARSCIGAPHQTGAVRAGADPGWPP